MSQIAQTLTREPVQVEDRRAFKSKDIRTAMERLVLCDGRPYTATMPRGVYKRRPRTPPPFVVCQIEGCENLARSRYGRWCEKHYYRGRRTGSMADRLARPPMMSRHGYLYRYRKAHPASSPSGMLYEHRRVFFEAHGPDGHRCHWCGKSLIWAGGGRNDLNVDHLDDDKLNNAPNNLVPACNRCNVNRGLFVGWLRRHRDDPVLKAIFERERAR